MYSLKQALVVFLMELQSMVVFTDILLENTMGLILFACKTMFVFAEQTEL